ESALGNLRTSPAAAQHGHQAGPSARAAALHQGFRRLTSPGGAAPPGAPDLRARGAAPWGPLLALVGFLLIAPPVFVCAPLAGLLLLSTPPTVREWGWLIGAGLWTAVWLQPLGGLGAQVARAGAVFLCGSFLALTLWRPSPLFSRALISAAAAGVALVAWMMHLGIGWTAVREAVDKDLSAYQEAARAQWQAAGVPGDLVARMMEISQTVSQLYPALLAIAAVAGLRLAWAWYHRVSTRPLGAPPPPFP